MIHSLSDELGVEPWKLERLVESHPKKGNAKVLIALKSDADRIANSGPVFVVLDRDQIRELWKGAMPPDCNPGIKSRILGEAPGAYELVFLVNNVESLTDIVCDAMGVPKPTRKLGPDERDRLLRRAAKGSAETRAKIRAASPSFDRLVRLVSESLRALKMLES